MALAPGTLLDGYEILAPLGSGGMGDVYRARDPILKREVAIKVLPTSVAQDPDRLRRFEQEAQAAAALNHPNILAIHRFGVFEGSPYLVSELLEGSTLRQVEERGPLIVRKAIDIGVQIAHGLAAAHEKGIVHRDLKPENLFVTKDGRVKILDFGLAKLTQQRAFPSSDGPTQAAGTEPGMVLGTVGYMAPEQVRGLPTDHRTDIFAFGAVLYEMLSGKRAFQRSTSADTMAAILNEDPQSISQIAQAVPPGLQRVVQRCLEKNPEQRFQSASDLAFALEALSESGSSAIAPAVTPTREFRRSMPWMIGTVTAILLAAGVFYGWARLSSPSVLSIASYTQLTHDGHAGSIIGTDGSRIYLTRGVGHPIRQVSIAGGEIEDLPVPIDNPYAQDLSPDGSKLLIESFAGAANAYPLYSLQIMGGAKQYLADANGATWAPDGKTVAYFTPDGITHLIRADGTNDRKLAAIGNDLDSFSWSPDGRSIRYSRKGALWEMSADGTSRHELLQGWRTPHTKCCGSWSPDGTDYIFLSGPGPQIWAQSSHDELIRKLVSTPVQLTSGVTGWDSPIFTRDGKTILASGYIARGELVRLDLNTRQLEPFMGGISAEFASFSADGKTVAYVSYPEGLLWTAGTDGSARIQLTNASMQPKLVSLSPEGSQVVFVDSSANGQAKAWIVSAKGGQPQRLLPQDNEPETDPSWSPDGTRIAFSNSPEGGTDSKSCIRILDVATHQVRTLPGSTGLFDPHWSPDGKFLAADASDLGSVKVFNLANQQWTTVHKGILGWFIWSKDSRSLFLLKYTGDRGIYRIPATGGKEELILDMKDVHTTGYYGFWLALAPSGDPLLLRDLGSTDIYALSLEKKPD